MRFKFLPAVLASLMIAVSTQVAIAESPSPAFASPDGRQVPVGHWQYFFTPSHLLPLSHFPSSTSARNTAFSAVLVPCDGAQNACIAKVEYQLSNGEWIEATPGPDEGQRWMAYGELNGVNNWSFVGTSTFGEDLSIGRPQGGTARLWKFSNAPHAAGNSYQVAAKLSGSVQPGGKYSTDSFQLQVTPVTRIPGNSMSCIQPSIFEERDRGSSDGYCKTIYDFPENLKVRVTLKFGQFMDSIQGWFDGRLNDATININSQTKTIEFEAAPLIVPSAAISPIRYEDIPKNIPQAPTQEVIETQNRSRGGTAGFATVNNDFELQTFIQLGSLLKESAIGENSMWLISSIKSGGDTRCLQPGILNGVVLTNATVYSASAPKWSAQDSALDFKVAATHFNPKGELFKGYYKLLVSEKVASCFWGPDFSRGTASISVTNQDGTTGVATTNLGQRDGWVNFEAAGFTFSAPTIRAKILPYVAPVPTPTPTPSVKSSAAPRVKKTIICISSKKVIRKVTGYSPQCPSGFKKK